MWDCNENVTVLYEFEVIKKLGQEYTKLVLICKDKNSYYFKDPLYYAKQILW